MDRNSLSIIIFFVLGVVVYLPPFVVFWMAAEDVLAGSTMTSSVVMIAASVDIVGKLISPLIVSRLSLVSSQLLLSFLCGGSLFWIVFVKDISLRIVGLCILGYSYGMGAIVYLRQSSYYKNSDGLSSAFLSGVNLSSLLASIGYTGLTTWFCVAPRVVVACCIPISILPFAFYPLLSKKSSSHDETIIYTPISQNTSPMNRKTSNKIMDEIMILYKAFPACSYYFITNFGLQISMTSILTTLTFPSSPFLPRDHYQYYRLFSDLGLMLGGLEVVLASCLCQKHLEFFKVKRVWVLVILNVVLTVFFLCASWFHFLPNVYILFVLVFVHGLVSGKVFVHGIALASSLFDDARDKGTAMGYAEVGMSTGRFAASLLGLYIERELKVHCTSRLLLGRYCLARVPTSNGWEENVHCL